MANRRVALDLAAFLDSEEARALDVPAEAVRTVAERFLTVCYDELGEKPRLLDGQGLHAALGHQLPGHFKRADPLAEHAPAVLRAYLDHLEATQVVSQAFELRRALDEALDEFQEAVRTGRVPHHAPPQDPVVHKAPKLGRNDPCFCGSGRKFKKCHGQA